MKIYRCNVCGNILLSLNDSGVKPFCCGHSMELLKEQSTDGSLEKHVPIYDVCDKKVYVHVGSSDHPMLDVHYIEWIILETDEGYQIKFLKPNDKPKACFKIHKDEHVLNVYAYCNVHGLYVSE